jgi:hypothetical protein
MIYLVNKITYLQRRLHLVDVENLIGYARPTLTDATKCRDHYKKCARVRPSDFVVVACNHGAALEIGFGWRGSRLLLRSGEHGAELALLDVIAREGIHERFSEVVVGSGDGQFADTVAWLGSRGVEVTVVSNRHSLSRRLRLAAKRVVFFDPEPVPTSPAAILREVA